MGTATRLQLEWEPRLLGWFPNLSGEDFKIVGVPTPKYNCIAYAADDPDNWWWPYKHGAYWPEHATMSENITSLREVFAELGYKECHDSTFEPGYRKVALYEKHGEMQHAASQTPNGKWRSKIGRGPVVEHTSPEPLTSDSYGQPTIIMRKPAVPEPR